MSSFADRFGSLTVEQVRELNERAKQTCQWETTTEKEENETKDN